jgi:type I restriction enzyme M protein
VKDWTQPCAQQLAAQQKRLADLDSLATACRDIVREVDLVTKLTGRFADAAQKYAREVKDASAGELVDWDTRAIGRLENELDAERREAVKQLKRAAYFERQAHWLLSRFPEGKFAAVPGLCRVVTRAAIEEADWCLTPGRYVGIALPEVDKDFDFEQTLRDLHVELADLNREACTLAAKIQTNFEGLSI